MRAGLAQATSTSPQDWHLVFKARYGMQQVFAALAVRGEQREVVTQALTCSTAVDPILSANLRPRYGDINTTSLALDPDSFPDHGDWGAVVIQHTFGMIDLERSGRLAGLARDQGSLVVEDSAHALARMARGADGKPLADVSIHSFGVEKSLPTKFGGAVWVNPEMADPGLHADITGRLSTMRAPGLRLALAARTYRVQNAALRRLPSGAGGFMMRLLTSAKIFEPAVAPSEQAGRLAHSDVGASPWVVSHMAAHLPSLAAHEATRVAAVAAYVEVASELMPWSAAAVGQPLIRMPLLVPPEVDADLVVQALRKRGIYAGTWYRPALFPGVSDPDLYYFDPQNPSLPVTQDVIARIVNLPTSVDGREAYRIAREALEVIDSFRSAST